MWVVKLRQIGACFRTHNNLRLSNRFQKKTQDFLGNCFLNADEISSLASAQSRRICQIQSRLNSRTDCFQREFAIWPVADPQNTRSIRPYFGKCVGNHTPECKESAARLRLTTRLILSPMYRIWVDVAAIMLSCSCGARRRLTLWSENERYAHDIVPA